MDKELEPGDIVRITRWDHKPIDPPCWMLVIEGGSDNIWDCWTLSDPAGFFGSDDPHHGKLWASEDEFTTMPEDKVPDEVLRSLAMFRMRGET